VTAPPFQRVVVLLNPAGASGKAGRRWAKVSRLAAEIFPNLEIVESHQPGELRSAAGRLASAAERALLIAAGGDGTSHEVINGLIDAGPASVTAMGWLPIGSGNDLARSIGVPLDPAAALRHYRSLTEGRIDAGRIRYREPDGGAGTRTFGNSFTIGLSADVLQLVRHGRRFGALSYFAATVRAVARHHPFDTRCTADGVTIEVTAARLISVTNGASFGAGMRVTPDARLDDGRLDLLAISGISRLATLAIFPRVYWNGHLHHPAVRIQRMTRLTIEVEGIETFEVDGELIPARPPFEIEILPAALRIVRGSK
jgi:YegS/Rv2252/BmrU family lipid kinase